VGEHEDVLGQAAAWGDAGLGVALATVVSTWGSAPRPAGSHLAVDERGDFAGSVSGGCVEPTVIQEALTVIREGTPRLLEFGVSDERAWEVGLACGGTIQVYVERLRREVLDQVLADLRAKRPAVLATWIESGRSDLLHPFVPSEPGEAWLRAAARAAAEADRAGPLDTAGGRVLLRVFNPPVRVVIVGAVHIAQALAPMVQLCGHDVVVVDPRRAYTAPDRFPGVRLVTAWPDEALAQEPLDRRSALVAMTHDPKIDDPAVAAALRSEAFYVGALGSKRTAAARRERLGALGFDGAALARVQGPVGLAIGARTPGEIAASVLAQLVSRLRGADAAVAV
jgi:xanthine dehydrogenase accessory factor